MIREMRKQDIDDVLMLMKQLASDLGETSVITKTSIEEHFLEMQDRKQYRILVYQEDESILGCLTLLFYTSFLHRKGTAQINELIVREDKRNSHIGQALLESAIALSKELGMDELEVGVMQDNVDALRFYRSHGIDQTYFLLGQEFPPHA